MNWKVIENFDDYKISSTGIIKHKEKIIKPYVMPNKYLRIDLCKNGIRKSFAIHRLVGFAFIKNPTNLPQINHKDRNRQNNTVENLEWSDQKYNVRHYLGITETHCSKGHEFTPRNSVRKVGSRGEVYRKCRICINEYGRKYIRKMPCH